MAFNKPTLIAPISNYGGMSVLKHKDQILSENKEVDILSEFYSDMESFDQIENDGFTYEEAQKIEEINLSIRHNYVIEELRRSGMNDKAIDQFLKADDNKMPTHLPVTPLKKLNSLDILKKQLGEAFFHIILENFQIEKELDHFNILKQPKVRHHHFEKLLIKIQDKEIVEEIIRHIRLISENHQNKEAYPEIIIKNTNYKGIDYQFLNNMINKHTQLFIMTIENARIHNPTNIELTYSMIKKHISNIISVIRVYGDKKDDSHLSFENNTEIKKLKSLLDDNFTSSLAEEKILDAIKAIPNKIIDLKNADELNYLFDKEITKWKHLALYQFAQKLKTLNDPYKETIMLKTLNIQKSQLKNYIEKIRKNPAVYYPAYTSVDDELTLEEMSMYNLLEKFHSIDMIYKYEAIKKQNLTHAEKIALYDMHIDNDFMNKIEYSLIESDLPKASKL